MNLKKIILFILAITISTLVFATTDITVWFSWEGQKEFQSLVNDFNASQSNYHVNFVYVPDMTQKLQISLSAGTALPDMALVRNDVIGMLVSAKKITPVGSVDALQAFTKSFELNGKIYAYPYYADLQVIYLNQKIYNGKIPGYNWTLSDLEQIASKIKESGHVGIALNSSSSYFFNSFYAGFNGGVVPLKDGIPIVDNSGTMKAFEFYNQIFKVDKIAASYNKSALIESFKTGKAGMLVQGSFLIPDFLSSKLDFVVLPYPNLDDGSPLPPTFDAKGFVVFKDSAAVKAFIDYVTSAKNEEYFCEPTYKLPANIDAMHALENSNDSFKVLDISAQKGLVLPTTTIFNDAYSNAITTALQLYLSGQMSLKEVLSKAQEYINSQAK